HLAAAEPGQTRLALDASIGGLPGGRHLALGSFDDQLALAGLDLFDLNLHSRSVRLLSFRRSRLPAPNAGRHRASKRGRKCATRGVVREGGVDPPRDCAHWILSPARLPIPPLSRMEESRLLESIPPSDSSIPKTSQA